METINSQEKKKKMSTNLTLKAIFIAALSLLLLIPGVFIFSLIEERSARQVEVEGEISQKWAAAQTIQGPMLVIPYEEEVTNKDGAIVNYHNKCCILPEKLEVKGTLAPEVRRRSIFKATVYQSDLMITGSFGAVDIEELGINPQKMDISKAEIFFCISDFRGISEYLKLEIDAETKEMKASELNASRTGESLKGFSAPIKLSIEDLAKQHTFSLPLKLRGSKSLSFIPMGKITEVNIKSSWDSPSFFGNFLPEKNEKMDDKGFDASWKVLDINRDYPQVWKELKEVKESSFGVSLLQTSNFYTKVERSVKYMLLFVGLTFALCFFIEILQKKYIHILQYALVGFALTIFYVLLLSTSEYVGFNLAYLIATLATVLLISFYSAGAFASKKAGFIFGAVLTALYGFIYVLIQLEDTALLVGSIGLFAILCTIMYGTRKIDLNSNE